MELTLASKGKPTRVTLNPEPVKSTVISHDKLDQLQSGLGNLSNTAMKGTANWIRTVFGRKSIEPGYADHVVDISKKLEDLYHVKEDIFDLEGGKRDTRPIVFANAEEILDRVMEERYYVGYPNVIALADGGGGFFKICLTVLPENHWDQAKGEEADDEDEMVEMMANMESPVKKPAAN